MAEIIVRNTMNNALDSDATLAVGLLKMHFHDYFVERFNAYEWFPALIFLPWLAVCQQAGQGEDRRLSLSPRHSEVLLSLRINVIRTCVLDGYVTTCWVIYKAMDSKLGGA
ncbi:hypothetical protein Syun_012473 [Stephania yunnanensis]|uniref:Peroxidase n=1 Tax=Stephania yunnanensis TaxID=152371 RepID=A0AAP0K0V6_9MAGN